jgi:hypothetical protein
MKTELKEHNELIAIRVPPGDRWSLVDDSTGEAAEFRLAPLDSKLYVIRNKEVEVKPPPVKKYNLYGDRD